MKPQFKSNVIEVNLKVKEFKQAKFKLSEKVRLKIDVENYSYYLGGKNLIKKLNQILDKIKYLKELNDFELYKIKYAALNNFYSELFFLLDFNQKLFSLQEYETIFNQYLEGIFYAKTTKQYKKITKNLILFENAKLLEFYPFLVGKDTLGEGYLVAINILLPKRNYISNKVYSPEMYKYYYMLLMNGVKQNPASDEAFRKFYPQSDLSKIKDLEKKKASFRRQACRTKI